ncbi:hypothetical protein CAPTEDRAFT_216420 [Capitella teleta]|uniref:PDZ domain-containing protein n=1 Tax=Capitella teleta TaxID=283909 RepID=R7TDT1_CAPTE|nr:hypothetical protein CAPTEDRAFT_216420 [Capitella teleta]|eukprot:ELT91898.1 hypothetical protein CAPTEDRAFT_216420 [Capitella teleta]
MSVGVSCVDEGPETSSRECKELTDLRSLEKSSPFPKMKFPKAKNDLLLRKPYGRRQASMTPSKSTPKSTQATISFPILKFGPITPCDHNALKHIPNYDTPPVFELNYDETIISGNILDKTVANSNTDLITKAEKLFAELQMIKDEIQANQDFFCDRTSSGKTSKNSLSETLKNFKTSFLTPKSSLGFSAKKKATSLKKQRKASVDQESICSEIWQRELGANDSKDIFESTRLSSSENKQPVKKKKKKDTISDVMQDLRTPLLPLQTPISPTRDCQDSHDLSTLFRGQTKVTRGQIKIDIYVNSGLLTVHVLEAVNWRCLPGSETGTFVTVSLVPSVTNSPNGRTEIVYNALNPVFDEKISFEMMSGDECQRVLISAWHSAKTSPKAKLLGCTSFGLKTVACSRKAIRGWYHLLPEHLGQLKYSPAKERSSSLVGQASLQPMLFTTHQATLRKGRDGYGFAMTGACPALVCRVEERKSADVAGMKAGDVITRINNENVSTANCDQVARIIRHCSRKVVIQFKRPIKDSELLSRQNSWPKLDYYECGEDSSGSSSSSEEELSFSVTYRKRCRRQPRRLAFLVSHNSTKMT